MKNKLTLHYVIGIVAFAIALYALYLLYLNPERTKSLIITIIGCTLVGVGQMLIIRQKSSRDN
jgi:hypothetical protein